MASRSKKNTRKKRVIVEETAELVTEPKVEIRRPATLAQALTEPAVRVVKPRTRIVRVERKVKRAA